MTEDVGGIMRQADSPSGAAQSPRSGYLARIDAEIAMTRGLSPVVRALYPFARAYHEAAAEIPCSDDPHDPATHAAWRERHARMIGRLTTLQFQNAMDAYVKAGGRFLPPEAQRSEPAPQDGEAPKMNEENWHDRFPA